MQIKILACVVTYNRLSLLKKCIAAIQNQTLKPNSILVVNNGSSDGTLEWLENQKDLISIHQENCGGAGGFHTAIEYGINHNYDWLWLMDDDGIPEKNALEELCKHVNQNVSALNSLVVTKENPNLLSFGLPVLNSRGFPKLRFSIKEVTQLKKLSKDGKTYPLGSFFNGTLIKREGVLQVGNINKNFFIWGDEFEFALRLNRYAPVLTVLSSLHYHPAPNLNPPLWKLYYGLRNSIYINRNFLNFSLLRNLKNCIVFFPKFFNYKGGFKVYLKAIVDGRLGKLEERI